MVVTVLQLWVPTPSRITIYIGALVAIWILYTLRNHIRNYIRCTLFMFSLKGPPAVPIFGNINLLNTGDAVLSTTTSSVYGYIFRIWVTLLPYVVLLEPDDIQLVLGSGKHTHKPFFYKLLDNFLGKGLITQRVDTWTVHRRLLQPAFHLQFLDKFIAAFAECADDLANKFLEMDNQNINCAPFVNDAVFEILSKTVFGLDTSKGDKHSMDEMPFRKGELAAVYRLLRPWLLFDWIYGQTKQGKREAKQRRDLTTACFKRMEETRRALRSTKETNESDTSDVPKRISLLEYMVQLNEKSACFTNEDIIEECCTFMLAGQDSVGAATAMTLFLLAKHPDWQDRCVEELDSIFDDDTRAPTMKDLKQMKTLEMCIKETMRLYPGVPILGRILKEDLKIGERVIPKGCGLLFLPYITHRIPEYFPDPEEFKPERFDLDQSMKPHPFAYLPFSAGPRNCIGYKFAMLEMKCMISAIIRKCKLECIPGKDELRPKFRVTLRAQGGLWVKIIARDRLKSGDN